MKSFLVSWHLREILLFKYATGINMVFCPLSNFSVLIVPSTMPKKKNNECLFLKLFLSKYWSFWMKIMNKSLPRKGKQLTWKGKQIPKIKLKQVFYNVYEITLTVAALLVLLHLENCGDYQNKIRYNGSLHLSLVHQVISCFSTSKKTCLLIAKGVILLSSRTTPTGKYKKFLIGVK